MLRRLLSLGGLCLLILVGSTTVVQAGVVHGHTTIDPRGDVSKSAGPNSPERLAPRQAHGDIVRTTFRHSENAVWMRMRFRELARTGDSLIALVRLRTNEGVYREVSVVAWAPRHKVGPGWRGGIDVERRDHSLVDCGAARHISYSTNAILFRLPRTCLDNPRWFRANAVFVAFRYGKNQTVLLDGGNNSPRGLTGWTPRLHH